MKKNKARKTSFILLVNIAIEGGETSLAEKKENI